MIFDKRTRKPTIAEMVRLVGEAPKKQEKIDLLRAYASVPFYNLNAPIVIFLRYAYNPKTKWLVPNSVPPFKPASTEEHNNTNFYSDVKMLYLFVESNNVTVQNLSQLKREKIFIEILERIHPDDAKLLLDVVCGNLPQGITAKLLKEAFKGIFDEQV